MASVHTTPSAFGLRLVATFEACKGFAVIFAGFGLFALLHENAQRSAEEIVRHLHLNPAKHIPRVFIKALSNLSDQQLRHMAFFAGLYALMRFVEAYGLWRNMRWAEWFAIFSGGIYIPFELHGLIHKFTGLKLALLILNVVIVAQIARALLRRKERQMPQA